MRALLSGAVRWWSRRSLRARLTASATIVIAAGVLAASLLLVAQLRTTLVAGVDAGVRQRALEVAQALRAGRLADPVPRSAEGDAAVQVVDAAGHVVASSANIDGEGRLFTFSVDSATSFTQRTVAGVPLSDNSAYRVVAVRAAYGGKSYVVYAGLPLGPATHGVAVITRALGAGAPILVALLAVVGWLLVGRALRPVEKLRQQASRITVSDLQQRLGQPPGRDELSRLAATLNELLSRLDVATRRQRQFVADAAHELRSPLASVRVQLDVAARHPGTELDIEGLRADVGRLTRLVDDLVGLARLDAYRHLRQIPVDLDDVVMAETRGPARMPIDVSGVRPVRVYGDAEALARVVRNLLDNALRHACSRVAVTLAVRDGTARLEVSDDGAGVPPAERERVFERFTRLDEARTADAGGSGLGLAIVRDVVAAHGGRSRVVDTDRGATFAVELPTRTPHRAARPERS